MVKTKLECPKCGKKYDYLTKYCYKCGEVLLGTKTVTESDIRKYRKRNSKYVDRIWGELGQPFTLPGKIASILIDVFLSLLPYNRILFHDYWRSVPFRRTVSSIICIIILFTIYNLWLNFTPGGLLRKGKGDTSDGLPWWSWYVADIENNPKWLHRHREKQILALKKLVERYPEKINHVLQALAMISNYYLETKITTLGLETSREWEKLYNGHKGSTIYDMYGIGGLIRIKEEGETEKGIFLEQINEWQILKQKLNSEKINIINSEQLLTLKTKLEIKLYGKKWFTNENIIKESKKLIKKYNNKGLIAGWAHIDIARIYLGEDNYTTAMIEYQKAQKIFNELNDQTMGNGLNELIELCQILKDRFGDFNNKLKIKGGEKKK